MTELVGNPHHLYFSYGSNMDADSMRQRYPGAVYVGKGYLENYRLVFTDFMEKRRRGGADILEQKGQKVWGLLYNLTAADLAALDANKVYPTVYDRFPVHIVQSDGHSLENVWTYALRDKSAANYPPTPAYLELLIQAAHRNQFPENYLAYLRSFQQ
jgi:gamma-glutamylcyclotransferase (GGCT)/AIG2-like uncharacterized protein YtfP